MRRIEMERVLLCFFEIGELWIASFSVDSRDNDYRS
jgi:hypothetical protein